MNKRVCKRWSNDELNILKENYDLSYEDLQKLLFNRTIRAIKHKIGILGLRRSEKKRWSKKELDLIKNNPYLTPKELSHNELVNRSIYQIAKQKRILLGTANRGLKPGWDVPSKELAYFLGALCSDGYAGKYSCEFYQKVSDMDFLDKVEKCVNFVFGLNVRRAVYVKKSSSGKEGKYGYLGIYSRELFKSLATNKAVKINNVKPNNEWIYMIDEKFRWVWNNPWKWYFISGLYDGDGCSGINSVTVAVAGKISINRLSEELEKSGFKTSIHLISLTVLGGNKKRCEFLNKLDLALIRKNKLRRQIKIS